MYILKKIVILPFLLFVCTAVAQNASDCNFERNVHELGIVGGASYYMGDFNPNLTPLKSPSWYGGLMYRYNFARYFAFRGQLGMGTLRGTGEGLIGLLPDPLNNNWEFNRPWLFVDVMTEFNFMQYNAADIRKKQRFTPVLLLGVGTSYLMANTVKVASRSRSGSSNASSLFFNIPVGIGAKWCFKERMTLGVEWIWRISFYNEVDYYKGVDPNHSPGINNDWIGTIGITLSYLFKQSVPCLSTTVHKPSKHKFKGILSN